MSRLSTSSSSDTQSSRTVTTIPSVTVNPLVLPPLRGSIVFDPTTSTLNVGNGTTWSSISSSTNVTTLAGNGLIGNNGNGTLNINLTGGTGVTVNNTTGNVALSNTAVAPGTYGNAFNTSQITVDQQGRITNAVNTRVALEAWEWTAAIAVGAIYPPGFALNLWNNLWVGTSEPMDPTDVSFIAPANGIYQFNVTIPSLDLISSNTVNLVKVAVLNPVPEIRSSDLTTTVGQGNKMTLYSIIPLLVGDQVRAVASSGGVTTAGITVAGLEGGGRFSVIRIA